MEDMDCRQDETPTASTPSPQEISAWLTERLKQEPPPAGIPQELIQQVCRDEQAASDGSDFRDDLYSLQAELTALSQETRLQGRSFKAMTEVLSPLHVQFERSLEQLTPLQNTIRRLELTLQEHFLSVPNRDVLLFLVDLRDRLRRGIKNSLSVQTHTAARGFWSILFRRQIRHDAPALKALRHGYQLTLDHLEEKLTDWGVSEILCENQPFDASKMKVVDIVESEELEEGTVVAIYRAGYRYYDEILRLAEVKVAKPG